MTTKLEQWLEIMDGLPDLPFGALAMPFLPWALPPTRHSGEPLHGPWSLTPGRAWATWVVEKAQVYQETSQGYDLPRLEARALSVWWRPDQDPSSVSIVCWDPTKKTDSVLDYFACVRIPSYEADQLYGWVIGQHNLPSPGAHNLPSMGAGDGDAQHEEEGNDDEA